MSENSIKRYLFVDFENLPNFKINSKFNQDAKMYLFVSSPQLKIPIQVAIESQQMGERLEWIMISNGGKNNLDFHICFFMGIRHREAPLEIEFELYSKDAAFDHLIEYLSANQRKAKRLTFDSSTNLKRPIERNSDETQI